MENSLEHPAISPFSCNTSYMIFISR